MAIKRPDLSVIVVPDTNVLFTTHATELTTASVVEEMKKWKEFGDIQLWIPSIVLSELIFKRCVLGEATLTTLSKQLRLLTSVTGVERKNSESKGQIRRQIQRRYLNWCKEHGITIAKVPTKTINWHNVISASIWRLPPFSPFDPQGKSEKGFRDAMILETLVAIVKNNPRRDVTFLSNDKLLIESVNKRLKQDKRFRIFENGSSYLSFLQLEHDSYWGKWSQGIFTTASQVFYTPSDQNSVYYKFNIPDRVTKQFGAQLAEVPPYEPNFMSPIPTSPTEAAEMANWSSEEKISLGATNYAGIVPGGEAVFRWKTVVEFGRLFGGNNVFFANKFRTAVFNVFWRAAITKHPIFSDVNIDDIVFVENKIESPTDDLRAKFGFPTLAAVVKNFYGNNFSGINTTIGSTSSATGTPDVHPWQYLSAIAPSIGSSSSASSNPDINPWQYFSTSTPSSESSSGSSSNSGAKLPEGD